MWLLRTLRGDANSEAAPGQETEKNAEPVSINIEVDQPVETHRDEEAKDGRSSEDTITAGSEMSASRPHESDSPSTNAAVPGQCSHTSMLPPPRPPPSRAPNPTGTASLRVPSTAPSTMTSSLGLPATSQQRVSNSTSKSSSNSRGKVILTPGHSPLDWAALSRSGSLSGVQGFQRVTPAQLRSMTGRKGKPAWSSWQGKVYNITPYLPFHPGGEPELLKAAGRDGTKLFMDIHPWVNWENMLQSCLVGVLVSDDGASAT